MTRANQISGRAYLNNGRAIGGSAIPDSVDYRWTFEENSSPFVDEIGGVNATNNGTTQVTGSEYVNNAARKGDSGNNAYINYGTIGSLGSACGNNELTLAFTLDSLPSNDTIWGVRQSDGQAVNVGIGTHLGVPNQSSGNVYWDIRDTDGNNEVKEASVSVDDGNRHTIVCRKSSGANVSNFEIIVDGDLNTTNSNDRSQGASDSKLNDLSEDVFSHGANYGGITDANDSIFDDIQIDIGTEWTDQQVTDYDAKYR